MAKPAVVVLNKNTPFLQPCSGYDNGDERQDSFILKP
jgi:hypothetical protein